MLGKDSKINSAYVKMWFSNRNHFSFLAFVLYCLLVLKTWNNSSEMVAHLQKFADNENSYLFYFAKISS